MSQSFVAGGPLTADHSSYVRRLADGDALRITSDVKKYMHVIAPRQMGKTSLLKRLAGSLREAGWRCGYVDLSALINDKDEVIWYKKLGSLIWRSLTPSQQPGLTCQLDFREYLIYGALGAADAQPQIALFFDEVGAMAEHSFSDSFFMTLRTLYSERDDYAGDLVVVMAGTVDPKDLVENDSISPFNVSEQVELEEFTPDQTRELTGHLAESGLSVDDLAHARIYEWTSGQPYLSQRLCYVLEDWANKGYIAKISPAEIDQAVEKTVLNPINRDSNLLHTAHKLTRLSERATLLWQTILASDSPAVTERGFYELYLTGVVKQNALKQIVIRNRIYEQAFIEKANLLQENMPDSHSGHFDVSKEVNNMNYKHGLFLMKAQLEQTNRYNEFTTLEGRLHENLRDESLYGSTESTRAERARIVSSLNGLALDVLDISFNDLVLGHPSEASNTSARESSLVRQLGTTPSSTGIKPPVQTRLQDLPFNELSWEQFEALCAALVETQPITISCNLYGVQGDEQQGIDIVAKQRGKEDDEVWAYQCKRYKEYTPRKLTEALDKMSYQANYYVLMLSIPATAAMRRAADERTNAYLWDGKDIARKLKNYPALVEDFFGLAWSKAFCGSRRKS